MRLSVRVFLGFFLIVGLAAFFLLNTFMKEVRPGVRQGMEVALVDTANLLAELATEDFRTGTFSNGRIAKAIWGYEQRELKARIWGIDKQVADFRVYITDAHGRLLFDSGGEAPGQDYSRWNDVQRTLRGEYGARSTRSDPKDESTSAMHVAAPVFDGTRLLGVLTVATPTASVLPFAQRSQHRVVLAGLGLMGSALVVGLGFSWWLTRSIGSLQSYAREISEGRKATLPKLGAGELAELGVALESMREKLEGRQYVERYVHALTHEMKSPLAGIRGAAELLQEEMPEPDRQRFLTHIQEQEGRLRRLVDRMLDLATLQHRQGLQSPELLPLAPLVQRVVESKTAVITRRALRLDTAIPEGSEVWGEAFLLEQALSNLLDNAIEFSDDGGTVAITFNPHAEGARLAVRDMGPGIPAYALERVMEPFYSLPRPNTHAKSTGLGLSFVSEVAQLHRGRVEVRNLPEGGVEAGLLLGED